MKGIEPSTSAASGFCQQAVTAKLERNGWRAERADEGTAEIIEVASGYSRNFMSVSLLIGQRMTGAGPVPGKRADSPAALMAGWGAEGSGSASGLSACCTDGKDPPGKACRVIG